MSVHPAVCTSHGGLQDAAFACAGLSEMQLPLSHAAPITHYPERNLNHMALAHEASHEWNCSLVCRRYPIWSVHICVLCVRVVSLHLCVCTVCTWTV